MPERGVGRDGASGAPRISVIIPTRDRPEDVARCVASVLVCEHDSFEVIVVDQSDRTSPPSADRRVVHVETGTRGKSAGLNVGIATARADLLAFTDDDCTVSHDWLTRIEDLFTRMPEVEMAFGVVLPVEFDLSEAWVPEWQIGEFEIVHRVRRGQARGGAGGNMAARRSMFEAIGPWDEQIGPGSRFKSCEEGDIIFRALTGGHTLARVPDLTVTHWEVKLWADGSGRALKQSYAYGRGAVIGKHLRLGDRHMVPIAARELVEDLWLVARGVAHPRGSGIGQLPYKWRGLAEALSTPVDRPRRLFADLGS